MIKYSALNFLFILINIAAFAQDNTPKTYFDRLGKSTKDSQAYYYRQKTDAPLVYKCFYINGEAVYFEGKITQANDTDETKNIYVGSCTWYHKNGNKKHTRNFKDDGREDGTSSYYFETGKIWKEIQYKNGSIVNNEIKEYSEDGQVTRIFEENFDNNDNDWDLYASDKSAAAIKNSLLELTSFTKEGASRYVNRAVQSEEFALEVIMNTEKLKDGEKAGIIYGFKDWQNYNFFLISSTSFYIGLIYEGVSSIKANGMYSGDINKKASNNIKIISNSEKNIYSVNGSIQFSSDRHRNFGNNVGFAVSGKSTVSVDKLIYKEINFKPAGTNISNSDLSVKSFGSGIIFTKSGYILTNYHVIENANTITVELRTEDGAKSYSATVVQKDIDNDLAIVKIGDAEFKPLNQINYSFKENGSLDVGASVYTIGFPLALTGMGKEAKFTDGKISSKTGYNNAINAYQTSIPVQPGNSGGPLFDGKGAFVGIINSKVRNADNVSYAIKLNYIRNIIELLPEVPEIPNNHSLDSSSLEEQVKTLSNYVVLIKIK